MRLSELAKHADTDTVQVLQDCEVGSAELCAAVRGPDAITYLEKEKFLSSLEQEGVAAVICTESMAEKIPPHIRGILISDAPKFAFEQIHNHFAQLRKTEFLPQRSERGRIFPPLPMSPLWA